MTEQQFEVFQECEYLEEWSSCPYCIKYDGETVFETLPLGIAKEVCKKLNEQQAEIDDLKEENEQLREINKELGDDLYNCRLNKNIIREKLKLWQDVHKEYNIYSVKDFEESFELDAKINKEKGI